MSTGIASPPPEWRFSSARWLNLLSVAWSQAPESAAYGLLALAPLGQAFAPVALAMGLLGAVVGNLVGAILGAGGLVTAPRAALSLLTAGLVAKMTVQPGVPGALSQPEILALLALSIMAAGCLQIVIGALGIGSIVKFTPHPVRVGLISAVGVLLALSALAAALGGPLGVHGLAHSVRHLLPGALGVALVAALVKLLAERRHSNVPPILMGLAAGSLTQLVLHRLQVETGVAVGIPSLSASWYADLGRLPTALSSPSLNALWMPMATFAVTVALLATLDTMLAASVIDGRIRRFRDVNEELRVQGLATALAGVAGGLPNAISTVRSLALLYTGVGPKTSVLVYALALLGLLQVPQLLGWLPLSAIAGILVLQGLQTIDPWLWRTLVFLVRQGRSGVAASPGRDPRRVLLDNWIVALTVVVTGLIGGLVAAVAAGAALSVLLFVRANMREVVRNTFTGAHRRSMTIRSPHAASVLQADGHRIVLLELQGALFFGTADAIRAALARLPTHVQTVVLDLRMVGEIDVTGARILLEVAQDWAAHDRHLTAAEWADKDARKRVVDAVADSAGLPRLIFFSDADQALDAAEDRLLADARISGLAASESMALASTSLGQGLDATELALLEAELVTEHYPTGAYLFRRGAPADAFYLTLAGHVGIHLPGSQRRLVSFAPGTIVGEMAALARGVRSADAVAESPVIVSRLSTEALDRLQQADPALACKLLTNVALHLGNRLRDLTEDMSSWVNRSPEPPLAQSVAIESGSPDDLGRSQVH